MLEHAVLSRPPNSRHFPTRSALRICANNGSGGPLGYEKAEQKDTVIYTLPDIPDRFNGPGAVYVTKPYDGREATVGNGSMIAFRVPTHAQVYALHSAGVAAGGTDEGAPGFRAQYSKKSSWVICAIRWATS